MRYRFVQAEKVNYPILMICCVMRVSRSGYYQWIDRPVSNREKTNQTLLGRIQEIHQESRGTYGSPRVYESCRQEGCKAGVHRVARLMKVNGIRSCYGKKRRFPVTTNSNHGHAVSPNLLRRDFSATAPNQVWVSDITYIPTGEGWLYLGVVLDLYDRSIVGWAMETHLRHTLATRSLAMAVRNRGGISAGLIHHSDRGIQYAAEGFQDALSANGMLCSMSAKGNCLDNAVAESFFKTLKVELVYRKHFETMEEARTEIFEYVEVFYNQKRLHSYLGYKTPAEYGLAYSVTHQITVH